MTACTTHQECYKNGLEILNQAENSSIYSPMIFPLTGTRAKLNISALVYVYKLMSLTNDKVLSVSMEIDLTWTDPNFPANWTHLPDYTQLYINSSSVWKMNLYIVNPASEVLYLKPSNRVYVYPTADGSAGAIIGTSTIDVFVAHCDTMDLQKYPFDTQKCSILVEYGDSWTYESLNFLFPVALVTSDEIDNDEWLVENISIAKSPTSLTGGYFVGIQINFTFQRKSLYYTLFLIIPTILIQSLGALTLILPSDEGEKITLGGTLLVAMYVLFTYLGEQIPQVSQNKVPKLVVAVEYGTVMTAISLLAAVCLQTIRIYAVVLPMKVHQFFDYQSHVKRYWNRKLRRQRAHLHPDHNAIEATNNTDSSEVDRNNSGLVLNYLHQSVENDQTAAAVSNSKCKSTIMELRGKLVSILQQVKLEEETDEYIDRVWRNMELLLNTLFFLAYVVILAWFFGAAASTVKIPAQNETIA